MSAILILALLLYAPLLLVDLVFLAEVLLGVLPLPAPPPLGASPRIALIVPAHNEEGIVRATVEGLVAASPPGTRVLLVAHNCNDGTAAEARAGGAEVLVLDEPGRRGKGYALAGGRAALAADPPEVVVLIDADCTAEPGAIARLADSAWRHGAAVQASYLFRPRAGTAAVVAISNFAMLVKNLVRQRGGRRLGAPALLTGSGMAFPWALFERLELATGHIVEDLMMGVELVAMGRPPRFEDRATIWSDPSSAAGTGTQRARWEGGFLATGVKLGLPLALRGAIGGRWRSFWMGLHLLTPPLTLLLVTNGAALLIFALIALMGAGAGGFWLALGMTGLIVAAVLAAWAAAGRAMLPAAVLVRLPLYLGWKLMLYTRIMRGRETPAWIRTERVD